MLIIALANPHSKPSRSELQYLYWMSENGQSISKSGQANASLLTQLARNDGAEVIALIPWQSVSWHNIKVPPKGLSQINAALAGILEDQLLDETDQTHFILPSNAHELARSGAPLLVGACSKAWLRETLSPLQEAGLLIQRMVCELTPLPPLNRIIQPSPLTQAPPRLVVMNAETNSFLAALCSDQGVQVLPPDPSQWTAFKELGDTGLQLICEPHCAKVCAQVLGQEPQLQTQAQRALSAVQSNWDAASGEWAQSSTIRFARRVQRGLGRFANEPEWFWSRVALVACLVINLVGLNAWALIERMSLAERESKLTALIKETFPTVGPLVNPSLQMQREMKIIQHARGQSANGDLENMLGVVAAQLPAGYKLQSFEYAPNELRLNGVTSNLISGDSARALQQKGYALRYERTSAQAQAPSQTPGVLIITYNDGLANPSF
jgi:general secretion pathway protein L